MSIFSLLVSVVTLQFFFFTLYMVEGPSMEPSLHNGDVFLIDHAGYSNEEYVRGDIIVFSLDNPEYFYVKRIVGLPGDRIQVREDGIFVGESGAEEKIVELYLDDESGSALKAGAYRRDFRQTYNIPEGKYFVLGDNRSHSLDSRYFDDPFVPRENIKGKYLDYLFNLSVQMPTVIIKTDRGSVKFKVEVADEVDEQRQGLMFREVLPSDKGMLFVFDDFRERSFWMKNTYIPLDMIFLDDKYNIVHIEANAKPCNGDPCENYPSGKPAKYVLEVGGGRCGELGIDVGDTAEVVGIQNN